MTTQASEGKPKREPWKTVRMPSQVYDLMVEAKLRMGETGQKAVWKRSDGAIVHGSAGDAPFHVALAWALTMAIEVMHPDREQLVDAHLSREAYLDSFKEPKRKPEKIRKNWNPKVKQ